MVGVNILCFAEKLKQIGLKASLFSLAKDEDQETVDGDRETKRTKDHEVVFCEGRLRNGFEEPNEFELANGSEKKNHCDKQRSVEKIASVDELIENTVISGARKGKAKQRKCHEQRYRSCRRQHFDA